MKGVTGIQGVPVNSAAPNDKDALLFDGGTGEWVPGAPPQPLEPWVGTVNTQAQVIQRIPWTCSTTGTTPVSTGVSYTLSADTGLVLVVCAVMRLRTSPLGVFSSMHHMVIANVGGTIVTPATTNIFVGGFNGSIASGISVTLSVSGTTVTLMASGNSGSALYDLQGYVDLMVI